MTKRNNFGKMSDPNLPRTYSASDHFRPFGPGYTAGVPHDDADAAPLPSLRATSWAVLGLLSFGEELSGYDLKKWADWSLRFFYWAPSYSQIYGELRKLEEIGR